MLKADAAPRKHKKVTKAAALAAEQESTKFVSFEGDIRLDDPYGLLGGLGVSVDALEGLAPSITDWASYENGLPSCLAPRAPAAPDECSCGGRFGRTSNGPDLVCSSCGLIVEGDSTEVEDEARVASSVGRLTIVGPGSSQLQPDLYRSGAGCTPDQQKKAIFEEYKALREQFIEKGGRAFPLNACSKAAEYYNKVQQHYVKRSQNKKVIMAQFFIQACHELKFAPERGEVMRFMQLRGGVAKGVNFIRKLKADGHLEDVDVNVDPCVPEITTLFAGLELDHPRYKPLSDAVFAIVQIAIAKHIGSSSVLRSKVAGAGYAVLSRCTDKTLLQRPPTLAEFCASFHIRRNTIGNMLTMLADYHSHFKEVYEKAGLDSSPPPVK